MKSDWLLGAVALSLALWVGTIWLGLELYRWLF
jgi:hypothetical protein